MEKKTKQPMLKAFAQLMYNARRYSKALFCAIAGLIMTRAAEGAIYKFVLPYTVDSGLIEKDPTFLERLPLIIIGVFITIGCGEFLAKYFMGYVGRSVVRDYKQQMLAHLLKVPMSYYKSNTVGTLISKINYDAEQVSTAVSDSVREFINSIVATVILVGVMFSISWRVTLVVVCVAPIIVFVLRNLGRHMRRYAARVQNTMGEVTNVAAEIITGYQVIKLYQGNEYELARVQRTTEENRRQELKTFFISALSSPIMQTICGVVLVGFIMMVTHESIMLSPGQIIGLIGVMIAMIRPLKQISVVNNVFQKGITAVESIHALLSTPPEVNNATQQIINRPRSLEFRQVSFAYPDEPDTKILNNVSFTVKKGETIAIVGGSGSGKSTLATLLPRFYELSQGKIYIDSQDISSIELINLRQQIALMSQQVILFNDTVANNIAYGMRNPDRLAIEHAAKVANAFDFIQQLPHGFDTLIGENGCLLSGGQRQRLAIARAILKDAPILVMDEATSALDTQSENLIKEALTRLIRDRITIIIAHRLSTIEHADKIIVMDGGKIVETGTHQQLIAQQGRYAQLQSVL